MSTDKDTHTIQFCCGTTCDAEANLAYVKELEQDRRILRDELYAARRTICLLHRKVDRRNKLLDEQDEVINGLIKGDTTGTTR